MDDFLYQPYSIIEIKKYWENYLVTNNDTKIDFYLHIPFCHTLCKYCDYYKVLISQKAKEDYLDYIFWYLEQFKEIFKEIEFSSIYI
jgi:coproporphyrinogen III oxidase-like Fe-S oxidoreductase